MTVEETLENLLIFQGQNQNYLRIYYKRRVCLSHSLHLFLNVNLICTFILDARIFDPETSTFSSVGATTTCSHKGSGCALFYSPKHKNRPTVFIGGSNDTAFDNCAEVLDYTLNNSTWEKRMFRSYKIVFYYISSKINVMIIISLDCL